MDERRKKVCGGLHGRRSAARRGVPHTEQQSGQGGLPVRLRRTERVMLVNIPFPRWGLCAINGKAGQRERALVRDLQLVVGGR